MSRLCAGVLMLLGWACTPLGPPGGGGGGGGMGGGNTGPGPTAQGTVTGPAITAHVTVSDGGVLRSADGLVEVDVPAGALSADTDLTLTPITNEAPLGFGGAVRLGPEGTQFSTPATLVFHSAGFTGATTPDLLLAAYQDPAGNWLKGGDATLDMAAGTVAFPLPHFSDWSLTACARLSMDTVVLNPGDTAHLRVLVQCMSPASQGGGALGGAQSSSSSVQWGTQDSMGMSGTATLMQDGNDAVLTGPNTPPADGDLIISATWNGHRFTDELSLGAAAKFQIDGMSYYVKMTPTVTTTGSPLESRPRHRRQHRSVTDRQLSGFSGVGGALSDPTMNLPVPWESARTSTSTSTRSPAPTRWCR